MEKDYQSALAHMNRTSHYLIWPIFGRNFLVNLSQSLRFWEPCARNGVMSLVLMISSLRLSLILIGLLQQYLICYVRWNAPKQIKSPQKLPRDMFYLGVPLSRYPTSSGPVVRPHSGCCRNWKRSMTVMQKSWTGAYWSIWRWASTSRGARVGGWERPFEGGSNKLFVDFW